MRNNFNASTNNITRMFIRVKALASNGHYCKRLSLKKQTSFTKKQTLGC